MTTRPLTQEHLGGVITPIVKDVSKEIRDPGNYRGITIAPAMYKLFCSILNSRLNKFMDTNNYIVDNQNGFKKGRSTVDHLATLTNIIETRKLQKKDTFVAFIDFSKAYDRVNRGFLWKKLETMGVKGKMLQCLKGLYHNVTSKVKIGPGVTTDWFKVGTGLRQGCIVSPLCFNAYINDMAMVIMDKCKGVKVGNESVSILMYADDVALIAETEKDLQAMLNVLHKWCQTWDVMVNTDKSQVVHFRKKNTPQTMVEFKLSNKSLDKVNKYKYLGLVLDFSLDYNVTASVVAKSASRALGLLISKAKSMGGLSYNCFSKLYESCVIPIIRYGASIWGHKEYSCINSVHNRMCRYFLGVGKFTPNAAVQGDVGLRLPWQHQKLEMCRQWCRFVNMIDNRVNKRVFTWANNVNVKNWNYRVKQYLSCQDKEVYCDVLSKIHKKSFLDEVRESTERENEERWLTVINKEGSKSKKGKNKLRTYNTFKSKFVSEPYVYMIMPKGDRSAYAQFRCGTAPIKIETGRYEGLPVEQRMCPLCHSAVEDELHVLIECPMYNELRGQWFQDLSQLDCSIFCLSKVELLKVLLGTSSEYIVRRCAKACKAILQRRRQLLYK